MLPKYKKCRRKGVRANSTHRETAPLNDVFARRALKPELQCKPGQNLRLGSGRSPTLQRYARCRVLGHWQLWRTFVLEILSPSLQCYARYRVLGHRRLWRSFVLEILSPSLQCYARCRVLGHRQLWRSFVLDNHHFRHRSGIHILRPIIYAFLNNLQPDNVQNVSGKRDGK